MGIYDREYIRMGPRSRSGLGSIQFISFNSWIIILNVAVFLVDPMLTRFRRDVLIEQRVEPSVAASDQTIMRASSLPAAGTVYHTPVIHKTSREQVGVATWSVMNPAQAYGHFSTIQGFLRMEVWRLVTFQFLHANLMHLVLNMFGLWVFGGMVEQYLGRNRYAAFYLICGIAGGVSYLLLNLLGAGFGLRLPGVLVDSPFTPLVGASAGVFGVIMACAFIAPDAIVLVYLLPLKLKIMAYGYVALSAFNLLRGGANAGGDAAHIGGAIAGFFFIRNSHLLRGFFDVFGNSRRAAKRKSAEIAPADFNDDEVDRILDKVRTDGLKSLSDAEKTALRRASARRSAM